MPRTLRLGPGVRRPGGCCPSSAKQPTSRPPQRATTTSATPRGPFFRPSGVRLGDEPVIPALIDLDVLDQAQVEREPVCTRQAQRPLPIRHEPTRLRRLGIAKIVPRGDVSAVTTAGLGDYMRRGLEPMALSLGVDYTESFFRSPSHGSSAGARRISVRAAPRDELHISRRLAGVPRETASHRPIQRFPPEQSSPEGGKNGPSCFAHNVRAERNITCDSWLRT